MEHGFLKVAPAHKFGRWLCAVGALTAGITGTTAAHAQDVCVVCASPAATYRCTVEKSEKLARFTGAGDKALQHVCAKEMARQGGHEKCSVSAAQSGAACDGQPREVTLANLLAAPPEQAPGPAALPVKAAEPLSVPPRTMQELAERTGEKSKQQLEGVGTSFGDAAKQTWQCLSTLFQKC
jgi:hypothetical protein